MKEVNLPPGQRERPDFPRFGLNPFAQRLDRVTEEFELEIGGLMREPLVLRSLDFEELERVEMVRDFHCVTTWTTRGLRWSGWRFRDVYQHLLLPRLPADARVAIAVFRCQDGFRARLPLKDVLAEDVLLADRLNREPLGLKHGAPLRLVAPAHYGYKNPKHLRRIDLWADRDPTRFPGPRWMEHPRARVAFEERGRWLPGRLLRFLYRPLIASTVYRFQRALDEKRISG